jgi:uncharacterized protein DUF2510
VRCRACGVENPEENAFCGSCGTPYAVAQGSIPPARPSNLVEDAYAVGHQHSQPDAEPARRSRFRGPIRLAVVGAVQLVAGGAAFLGASSAVQAEGAQNFVGGLFSPLIDAGLSSIGLDQVVVASKGGGASTIAVLGFVVGFLVAALGALFLLMAAIWAGVRGFRQARGSGEWATAKAKGQHGWATAKPKLADAAQRGQTTWREQARPKLTDAASRGQERWQTQGKPKLAQAAQRGQEGWQAAKPKLADATAKGKDRIARLVRERRVAPVEEPLRGALPPAAEQPSSFREFDAPGPVRSAQCANAAPPGWYEDPATVGRSRYWDGDRWTDAVSD